MDYQRRVDQTKRILLELRKSIKLREEYMQKGETTYTLDAEIRGSFSDLIDWVIQDSELGKLANIIAEYNAGNTELAPKDVQKRKKVFTDFQAEKDKLRTWYDSFFEKKAAPELYTGTGDKETKFTEKYDTTGLNTKQLNQLRTHELNQQEEALDGLINAVQGIKHNGLAMDKQFTEQAVMLNELEDHVDKNTSKIGRVRGKMMKLLEKSSNCCLGITIFIEIAAIVLLFALP